MRLVVDQMSIEKQMFPLDHLWFLSEPQPGQKC